ncbi:MAG: hypothetical protein Q8O66_00415 [bacterium]|nr:hypothetical protein [bacterium]
MISQIKKRDILKTSLILLILISSVVFLYSPYFEIKNGFGGGDNLEWYQEAKERDSFKKIWDFQYYSGRLGPSAFYNPVQLIIWRYMANRYGQQFYPYNILGMLIHLINIVVVFFFVNKFIKNKLFSFLTALSFGIFYLNFQTISWVAAGIAWGLVTFCILTTLLLVIKYFQTKNKFFYFSSLLILFLGTFIKEIVVFAVPVLLAYYFIIQRERVFKFIKSDLVVLPYFMLSLPIILITLVRLNKSAIANVWGGTNFGAHMFYRFIDFFNYLIAVVPASFNIQMAIVVFILLLFPALIYYGLKDKKLLFISIWLFLSLSISIFQNFRDIYSLERYLYLSSVAWFALLYYIVANIKNLKIKIISSFFLVNYTIILNLLLILKIKT